MSIEKTYKCNLCREKTGIESLLGVSFEHRRKFHFAQAFQCETHICKWCVQRIQKSDPVTVSEEELADGH